jgi:hypothetical protein
VSPIRPARHNRRVPARRAGCRADAAALFSESTMKLLLRGLLSAVLAGAAGAAEIGQIKVSRGAVSVERAGKTLPGVVGLRLHNADVLKTGADASVGITLRDNSLLSAGPNSIVALDGFDFDAATSEGRLDAELRSGTLAVISGRIARQSPQSMTVRTPTALLGVRGTDFVVSAGE